MNGKKTTSKRDLKKFGVMMSVATLFIPAIFCYFTSSQYPWQKLLFISAAFFAWSLAAPKQLIYIYKPWMKFAMAAGWLNSRIILSFFYYLIFTPIALIARKSRSPLALEIDGRETYFEPVSNKKIDMKKGY